MMSPFYDVVITRISQCSICGESTDSFWDTILLKKDFSVQFNERTGRFMYFVDGAKGVKNKYQHFIKTALTPLLNHFDEDRINLIVGSSFGDHSGILEGADSLFPSRKAIEKLLDRKLAFYCNISTSCTSSLNAIGYGYHLIKTGQLQHVIVGGCEALDDYIISGMDVLRVLSKKKRSTPFTASRDGTTLGEGAAFVVLQRMDNAVRAHEEILAEVKGYANSNDAYDITRPDMTGLGLITTMRECLGEIDPQNVKYVNSHGTGTLYNDIMETNALKAIFSTNITTSTIKPVIGHSLGACGAFETLACVLCLQNQIIPPTCSDGESDAACDLDYCFKKPRKAAVDYVINNSVGFWGTNASLLLRKFK
ncbi:MAG: beta-ketoacyl-[acyl-carrier-protein] synthase family protein [Candidatus Omnitrophica bacterium]|nr:beta-ketoacyl-[acyl-carrier-protein] synthase family protein [Candidatus Omnitrophota bacterium]